MDRRLRLSLFAFFLSLLCLTLPGGLTAQWEPGAVYREYHWVMPPEGEAFLRVGGRYGYASNPGKLPPELQRGEDLLLAADLDLAGAVRAEVVLEKVLSHEDSRKLTIAINGHPPLPVPEPGSIPEPQTEYMYHTDVRVPIPLEQLAGEGPLRFRLALDTTQRWNWPQNVLYGLTFRLYYAPAAAPPELADLPDLVPRESFLRLHAPAAAGVDYVFVGREADWSGRGRQHRTHWQTHRGRAHHIIGSSEDAAGDFAVVWNTAWLPDQPAFGVQARVLGADGKYRVSKVREGLRLADRPYVVRLYASGPAPRNWVTRSGEFTQAVVVADSVQYADRLRLHWTSWSPCYSNGLFLNEHLIWDRTDDCYVFATHSPVYRGLPVSYLQQGENVFRTALTPLVRGHMVHGMEVQWPGIQLKVRYRKPPNRR